VFGTATIFSLDMSLWSCEPSCRGWSPYEAREQHDDHRSERRGHDALREGVSNGEIDTEALQNERPDQ
jgi:hypothetical protein